MGLKFRRQQPIGQYIVDFVCLEKKLIIEVDGGQHAKTQRYDKKRNAYLEQCGYRILRYWNNQISHELDGVIKDIQDHLHPHLDPPPEGGG